MKMKIWAVLMLSLGALLFSVVSGCIAAAEKSARDVPRMPADELKSKLDDSSLVVMDVRTSKDWEKTQSKIKGAVREDDYINPSAWASKYPKEKTIVLYCA